MHDPSGPGLLTRVLRMSPGYIVPRGDGRYVLGATMEERGFDTTVTAGAIFELLRDAIELVPGIDEWVIDELIAGLRPGTPDNAPVLGPGALDGPAMGHRPLPPRGAAGPDHRRARGGGAGRRGASRDRRPVRGGSLRRRGGAGMSVRVTVNGEARELEAGATVADVVASLPGAPDGRGVAVALDGEVVRRGGVATAPSSGPGPGLKWLWRFKEADAMERVLTIADGSSLTADPGNRRLHQPRAALRRR